MRTNRGSSGPPLRSHRAELRRRAVPSEVWSDRLFDGRPSTSESVGLPLLALQRLLPTCLPIAARRWHHLPRELNGSQRTGIVKDNTSGHVSFRTFPSPRFDRNPSPCLSSHQDFASTHKDDPLPTLGGCVFGGCVLFSTEAPHDSSNLVRPGLVLRVRPLNLASSTISTMMHSMHI